MIKGLCFVEVKHQKRLLEKSKKIQFHESQSIENSFQSIECSYQSIKQELRIIRVI